MREPISISEGDGYDLKFGKMYLMDGRNRMNALDGAKTAIEFSLDDPQACSAVKEQLTIFFGQTTDSRP
jgi:hypothetical protein